MKVSILALLVAILSVPAFAQKVDNLIITENLGVVGINKTSKGAKFSFSEDQTSEPFCFMPMDIKNGELKIPTDVKGVQLQASCAYAKANSPLKANFKESYGKSKFDSVAIFKRKDLAIFFSCFQNKNVYVENEMTHDSESLTNEEIVRSCLDRIGGISIFPFKNKGGLNSSTEEIYNNHVNESLRKVRKKQNKNYKEYSNNDLNEAMER